MLSRKEIALKASQAAAEQRRAARSNTGSSWRKTKPGRASMISITPAPKPAVESAHTATISLLSELRLGLLADQELTAKLRETEARVRQLSRLAGPLALNASGELAQERVNLLSLQNEIQRRQLSRLQREQSGERVEELAHA